MATERRLEARQVEAIFRAFAEVMRELPPDTEAGWLDAAGDLRMPTFPVRFDGKPPEIKPAPLLGQHTEEVFAAWLRLGAGDVAGLKEDGVI